MKRLIAMTACSLLLFGCNADGTIETQEDKAEKRTEVYDYDSDTGVLVDKQTGCQYLFVVEPWIKGSNVVPRYESDGNTVICNKH